VDGWEFRQHDRIVADGGGTFWDHRLGESESEERPISVLQENGQLEEWRVKTELAFPDALAEIRSERWFYRLTLAAPDGRVWTGQGGDVFAGLLNLRRVVEPLGLRLCCNGSRLDAWSSGMQRDMASGKVVSLLHGVAPRQRPPAVNTLDPAPANEVVFLEEQQAWVEQWHRGAQGHDPVH
jgi:hypothetical protein